MKDISPERRGWGVVHHKSHLEILQPAWRAAAAVSDKASFGDRPGRGPGLGRKKFLQAYGKMAREILLLIDSEIVTDFLFMDAGAESGETLFFPVVFERIGDRDLWARVQGMKRPWEARSSEVFALERHCRLTAEGKLSWVSSDVYFWRPVDDRTGEGGIDLFLLGGDAIEEISPLLAYAQIDPVHGEMLERQLLGHHRRRMDESGECSGRDYVCLLFWGGMAVMEESVFRDHEPGDSLTPVVPGGAVAGIIWDDVPAGDRQDALIDLDIIVGKYVVSRLYPGLQGPTPTGRRFGLEGHLASRH